MRSRIAFLGSLCILLVGACGAGLDSQEAQRVAAAALTHVPNSTVARARLATLLEKGTYAEAGRWAAHYIVKGIETAPVPTVYGLRINAEPLQSALPATADHAASVVIRRAMPRIRQLEREAAPEAPRILAKLRQQARKTERVSPAALRKSFLQTCNRHSTRMLCECALKDLEAHAPADEEETVNRFQAWLTKCELEEAGG